MTPRNPLHPPRQRAGHRHREDFTPRGIAAWLGCPTCQHGHPVLVVEAVAVAVSTIITAIAPGTVPDGGTKPLKGGGIS